MWAPTKNQKYGVVIYNYHCEEVPQSLKLDIGDTVQIFEECEGWYRGILTKNRNVRGIFPASYIHLKPFRIDNEGSNEVVLPVEDPVVQEATSVLREWGQIWKKLYVVNYPSYGSLVGGRIFVGSSAFLPATKRSRRLGHQVGEEVLWGTIRKTMLEVCDWRKTLVNSTLTSDQIAQLKLKITRKIDWGNRKLGLDLVPRTNGEMVDPSSVSVVELYQVHSSSAETSQHHHLGLSTLSRKKQQPKVDTFHLFFCMRDFSYQIGENMEIFFSLFDGHPNRLNFISERFLVKQPKEGFNNYVELVDSNCTIFTDLGNRDLSCDLYIVAHVVRVGKMLFSESTKKGSIQSYRRPYGVAVFKPSVESLKSEDKEIELIGKVHTTDEKDMWQLLDLIIKKQSNKFSLASSNASIVISIKLLQGDLDLAIKENPLLLKEICLTRKLGFADVIMPGEIRNDLYVTLSHGEFERGGKSVGKNIEITVIASDITGHPIQCIYPGTGHKGISEFSSTIMYHNNSPHWKEQLKIALPIDTFPKAHLRFEYRHCSTREKNEKKLFGFSFIRLMEDEGGTTLRNGAHELCVYKCDDRSRLLVPAEYYKSCPFLTKTAIDCVYSLPFQRSSREMIVVETLLCSTKLTQNVDLLSLLRWKSSPDGIGDTLMRLVRVDGAETVKFLQDVLDALFGMFSTEDGNSTQYSGHVFHALVFIFGLLEDGKFKHFKPVMDAYISGHFAAALVHKGLISCVKHLADLCPQTDKQDPILNCFCSLEYIFKFIIQSRLLYVKTTGGQNEDAFRQDIDELFESFVQLLSVSSDHILNTQLALLEHIQGACDQLYRTLSVVSVVSHLNALLYVISIDIQDAMVQAKLHAIKNAISPAIFDDEESRSVFLKMATDHLRHHLMTGQEVALCADVLSNIIISTHKKASLYAGSKLPKSLDQDIKTIVLKLVDVTIEAIISLDVSPCCYEENKPVSDLSQLLDAMKNVSVSSHVSMLFGGLFLPIPNVEEEKKVLGSLIASLMGIFQIMRNYHFPWLWEAKIKEGTKSQLKALVESSIKLFDQLVRSAVFPSDWFVMRMVANQTILAVMTQVAHPLVNYFLKDGPFDHQLWSTFFNLAVGFLTQSSLQLEYFSQQKRQKVLERYGDMRVDMGFQILSLWHNLDDQRLHFIPGMVGPFLEVTLVPEAELRKATLPIFFDMMQAEQHERGNFKQVETELIDKLDILVSENKGDDEYRQVFNTILLERVKLEDPAWSESGSAFIQSVTRLLERLLDYRSVMQGDENSDKRMSCTVNLLNFYKNEINRQEMYIRYIYKLHDLHLPAGNYTEAAFTLKLHATQLSWSQRMLHADHLYQAQTEFQRKETIYYRIIECFDKGKCWEEGIPLLEELAERYRTQIFNYKKLSDVHRQLATFYENILNGERYKHEYFRVGFYGHGLPLFVRNKVFIYRGLEYESIPAFTQRLQMEFPHAKLLSHNTPPDDVTKAAEEQFIQICAVKPIAESQPEFEGIEVDERILKYYSNNRVKKFVLDRPTHRGPIDKDNEFKNLWIERIIYTTESKLPGILKWFEVVDQVTEQVCPPQYASETVQTNIQQIRQMTAHYKAHPKENIQPFTMRLQGSIDAAVNGGIAKYQDAFFRHEYQALYPQFSEHVVNLKALMVEQTQILERALDLHGRIAPAVNQPLHKRLLEVFEGLRLKVQRLCLTPQSQRSTTSLQAMSTPTPTHRRADSDPAVEFRRIGSIINSPLPPVPSDRKEASGATSSSTSGHSSQRSSQSSSLYAHFQSVSHDDDLYTKPLEDDDATLGSRDSRPRLSYDSRGSSPRSFSVSGSSDYATAPSPRVCDERRRSRHHSRPSSPRSLREILNSSWSDSHSQGSCESVPPIPPKGTERNSRSISLGGNEDHPPPIFPKKLSKKMSSTHSDDISLISNGFGPSTPSSPPPAVSPRNQRSPPPPPIPPKSSLSTPITPTSSGFTSLRGSQEEIPSSRHTVSSSDNYSVPVKLKPPPPSPPL